MSTIIHITKTIIGSPSDFGVGWIIVLLSSLITIVVSLIGFIQWIRGMLKDKDIFLNKTQQLVIGMDIGNFENILGKPIFINKLDGDLGNYKEYLFSNRYFYTQAIINSDQQVVLFSITTKQVNFNPKFIIGGGGDSGPSIILGKTLFSDIGSDARNTFKHYDHGGIGFYSEIFYFGRSGHYLEYAFSVNLNGIPAVFDFVPGSFSDFEHLPDNPLDIEKFRSHTPINTFTVLKGIDTDKIENIILGPRTGQVWNLK